jgi:hypothetical protein
VQNSTPTNLLQVLDNGRIYQTLEGSLFSTTFGTSALRVATGANNSAFGAYAGDNVTTAINNTLIGFASGFNNTTGNNNVFVGLSAAYNNTTGGNNVAIGNYAGRYIAGGSTANTISNNSIFIGYNTQANANSETNQIVLGYQTTGLGSNTTTIGNSSTTQTHLYGNLTLGDTGSTSYRLNVSGSANITNDLTVTGSLNASNITGSLFGSSSYATQALSSSYAVTASYALNGGGGGSSFPYTGSAQISGSLEVNGPITGYRKVENKNSGYTITNADYGKTFVCNSASDQTFNLPSIDTPDIGFETTIIKIGGGKVTIDAADSDTIQDSGNGGTIYCSDRGIASITLLLARPTAWYITSAVGTWITTD